MSKRRKATTSQPGLLGAPSRDDAPNARIKTANQGALLISYSTRDPPGQKKVIPSLESSSCHVFAHNLETLFGTVQIAQGLAQPPVNKTTEFLKKRTQTQLSMLPPHLLTRLLDALRSAHPYKLNHGFLSEFFLHGPSLKFTASMTGVNHFTLAKLAERGSELTDLELSGIDWIGDTHIARLVDKCKRLLSLNLKWSRKVAAKTSKAICSCKLLQKLNLNYTLTPPMELATIILSCPSLELLKVASLPNFTDSALQKIVASISDAAGTEPLFPSLRSLKLRHNSLSETSLMYFLRFFPSLETVDLAFTAVRNIPFRQQPLSEFSFPPLSKLMLTSTQFYASDLVGILPRLPRLRKLHLGVVQSFSDTVLSQLTGVLAIHCPEIEDINLVRNSNIGNGIGAHNALGNFMRKIGRKCKHLNLASTAISPSALVGLVSGPLPDTFPEEYEASLDYDIPPLLQTLNLNRTKVDDTALEYIAHCHDLESLELESTRVSSEGLFALIDACPRLEHLNLTGCRGVTVKDRRFFFQVWEAARGAA